MSYKRHDFGSFGIFLFIIATMHHYVLCLPVEMWENGRASLFNIRGPQYELDGMKVPALTSAFSLVGVDIFEVGKDGDEYNIGARPESAFYKSKEFTFILNFIVVGPKTRKRTLALYFQPADPTSFNEKSLGYKELHDFINGDEEYRNKKLKFIPSLVKANKLLRIMVDSVARPVLVASRFCQYFKQDNYFEIDLDTSPIANILKIIMGSSKTCVFDLAVLFETENSENMLGVARVKNMDISNPILIHAT